MILGTVLESKSVRRTMWGLEYRVQCDKNSAANAMSGRAGTAIAATESKLKQGDLTAGSRKPRPKRTG